MESNYIHGISLIFLQIILKVTIITHANVLNVHLSYDRRKIHKQ